MKNIFNAFYSLTKLGLCLLLGVCLLSLWACSSGTVVVEKRRGFRINRSKPIVIIEPDFIEVKKRGKGYKQELKNEEQELDYVELINKSADKTKVKVTVVDAQGLKEDDTDYFNYMIPLKKAILHTNFTQEIATGDMAYNAKSKLDKGVIQETASIPAYFSALAKKYKTPYFALQGVFKIKKKGLFAGTELLFYHIIVDVTKGETMYRDLRTISGSTSSFDIEIILYDSFKVLRK